MVQKKAAVIRSIITEFTGGTAEQIKGFLSQGYKRAPAAAWACHPSGSRGNFPGN